MPSQQPLLLRNARAIGIPGLPDGPADLLLDGGNLSLAGNGPLAEKTDVIESGELLVAPGFIDLFADYREPGFEARETVATGLAAAAAGGFTQVCVLPGTNPPVSSRSMVESLLQKAASSGSKIRVLPVGTISSGLEGSALAEMHDMRAGGAVAFSDGWKPVQNPQLMLKALEYVKSFDGLLIQMPMDGALSAGALMHEGEQSTRLGMPGSPAIAEELFLHRDIELLRYTGSRLHVTGVSTRGAVTLLRKAKADGLRITASVTPYHLIYTDQSLSGYDSRFRVNPPLRTEEDRQALLEGLADGTLDAIASHHRPQDWDAKNKEFEYAGEGMALQQWVLPMLLTLTDLSPDLIVDKLSAGPARVLGLPTTGFVAFDPVLANTAAPASLAFNGGNLPGLRGSVLRIL